MKGRAAVRYPSCQATIGSEERVGKKTIAFFLFGVEGDVAFVVSSVCCVVLLSASLFTVQFLNRWRPVSLRSLGEVEEAFCWEEEVEWAASRKMK